MGISIRHIAISKITVFAVLILYSVVSLFFCRIPFFWDNVVVSQAACFITDTNFSSLLIPEKIDPGHTPIVSFYIAAIWFILGKSLFVSHLAILPFTLGLIWEFYKLCKQFLSEKMIIPGLIFLALEPIFNTQSLLMGYDIISSFLFLAAINCLIQPKKIKLIIILSFIALINLRGIPLVISIFLIHFFIYNPDNLFKFLKKNSIIYVLPALLTCSWFIYHYYARGWIFKSPSWETQREINSVSMMSRQFIYIAWKLSDYGKIIFWIFVLIFSIRNYKSNIISQKTTHLILITTIAISVFLIPFSNPIGHKYFLPVYLLLIILIVYNIQLIKSTIQKVVICIIFCLVSFSGNFFVYPERFGNGWDSSLKVISYFNLFDNTIEYINKNKIKPEEVSATFPLTSNIRYTHLSPAGFELRELEGKPLHRSKYIILSNMYNIYTDKLKIEVQKNWIFKQRFKSGFVYIELYQNPLFPN